MESSTEDHSENITQSAEEIVREIQENDWEDDREHFSTRMHYMLALLQVCLSFHGIFGCALSSIQHGGLVFFIPYTVCTIIFGYPIHFLECSLGQYSQLGPIKVWNCVPLARGIGWASILLCLFTSFYNNMYAAYAVIYFARCFDDVLPWTDCDSPIYKNKTCVPLVGMHKKNIQSPSEHYFYDHFLQLDVAKNTEYYFLGGVVWQQILALFYSWFVVYLCIRQNIRSLEKVLPILVGVVVFCLLLLTSLSIQIHGSFNAFKLLGTISSFHYLAKISTWCAAAQQVLLGLGIAQGTLIGYGSHAHHRNKTYKDSSKIICINYFIIVGYTIVVWFFLGAYSSVTENPEFLIGSFDDFGYVFVVFAEVLARLPAGRLWCMCVFILIFVSCLNSQIPTMQTIICVINDQFPATLQFQKFINLGLCIILGVLGIITCTVNGWVFLQLFHEIPNTLSRIPIASLTVISIALIYGLNKFCEDLEFLISYYPSIFLRLCFYSAPFGLLFLYFINNWGLFLPSSDSKFIFKVILYLILDLIPVGIIYWSIVLAVESRSKDFWRSLEIWGPRNEKARVARVYFSSESKVTLSLPWRKK